MEFSEFNVDPRLFKAVQKMGFERPTPIQASAIPPALTGQDIWGSAETGTGKTAAFLLPLMHRLLEGTLRNLRVRAARGFYDKSQRPMRRQALLLRYQPAPTVAVTIRPAIESMISETMRSSE